MKSALLFPALIATACCCLAANYEHQLSSVTVYIGLCDASAAVSLSSDTFVAASDENNTLRIYRDGQKQPLSEAALSNFLELETEHPEADIEGAARIDDTVFWICSHGANTEGHKRPNRRRLFATKLKSDNSGIKLVPDGSPYKHLVRDLKNDARLVDFKLGDAAELPPEKPGGLNIEGLSATPEGDLLIGFRNPIPQGKALLIPLKNPHKIMDGHDANLGQPVLLDLGGRGIRSIDYLPLQHLYLIVAGAIDDQQNFALFQWSGVASDQPKIVKGPKFDMLHPEALFLDRGHDPQVHFLSDDGQVKIGTTSMECKDLTASQQ
jgi:hypothetical protein